MSLEKVIDDKITDLLMKISDFSDSFLSISLMILSLESVFWDETFLLKDALFAPIEF